MRRERREGRIAGTRARGPAPEPGRLARGLRVFAGVLLLLGAVAVAPHAWDAAVVAVREPPFLLSEVTVRGARRLSAEEVVAILAAKPGTPLVDLDVAALEARLAGHPWIAEATVVRWPPDALRVRVRERVPLAVTEAGDPAVPHGVDATGRAFAPASESDVLRLVAIALDAPPAIGEPDPRLLEALRLAAALRERGLEVPRRVRLGLPGRARSAELRLRGFAPAIWIERAAPEPQLDRLALLLAANVDPAVHAGVIDLRFGDRAVLRGGP